MKSTKQKEAEKNAAREGVSKTAIRLITKPWKKGLFKESAA